MKMNKKEKHKQNDKATMDEEPNILYEVLVSNEWQEPEVVLKDDVLVKKALASARTGSRWFRPLSFSPNVYVPNSVQKLIDMQMGWQFAVGGQGKAVAILQDNCLEIRTCKDEYATTVGKTAIRRDPFPQWRKLCWSNDCSLLAIAYSNGELDVFDLIATKLFSISKPKSCNTSQIECSNCIVDVAFMDHRVKRTRWSTELVVCNFRGQLDTYYVNSTENYQEATSFSFNKRYPNGVTAFCCHCEHSIVFVGGMRMENVDEAQTHTLASHYEITAWRVLNDEPYYRLITTIDEDALTPSSSRTILKFVPSVFLFQKMKEEAVFKLSLSPNGQKLAAIHTSGTISIWEVPSLRLFRLSHLMEQPGYNSVNPLFELRNKKRNEDKDEFAFHLVDLNWWSDNALILGRCCGSVTVTSIATLKNLLGESCEWFEPMPQFSAACDKKFLTLECETQLSVKKRATTEQESSIDESSDEESYFFKKPSKLMKKALYYMTDSERFQPPRKRTKFMSKTYRLVCLKSTTPEELYKRRMDNEEYGEALALARTYGLDTDLVYQRQWKASPVSIVAIKDYLSKIEKRSWVIHECLERVSDDIDAVRELLMYGLKGTELEILVKVGNGEDDGRFVSCESINYDDESLEEMYNLDESSQRMQKLLSQIDFNNLSLEQKQLLLARRKLMSYLDRLETYEVMLGGPLEAAEQFDAKFFQKFRSESAVDAVIGFARNGDWNRVKVMLTLHGEQVLEHWLCILSNFPETTNPFEYRVILPECTPDGKRVCQWEQTEGREQDWCEDVRCTNAVGETYPETTLYEAYPELTHFRTTRLNPSLVCDWYQHRAREIEKRTCFVDYALELVKLGQTKHVKGLDDLYEDFLSLETLVYECRVECSLDEYQSMDDVARAHLIMSTATEESYIKSFRRWLIPFLDRRESHTKGRKLEIIRSYLLEVAESDLSRCLAVFQNSRIELSNSIVTPVNEMIDIALSCAYTCPRSDQLAIANTILECLPSRNYGPETPQMLKLHDWIDEFESHLRAALVLTEHDNSVPLCYIRRCQDDPEEVKRLFTKLTRAAAKRSPVCSEQQWFKVLGDILELQKIFHCVSPNVCYEIFVSSLLCSNNSDSIILTERLMECSKSSSGSFGKKISYDQAIRLVLSAAREYFNASSNLSDPCMDLAKTCLNLITDQPQEIEMELDLISALAILKEFNVTVLPLQVRLCEDRIQLIEMALGSKPKMYTQVRKLLKLAYLLRVSGDDKHIRDGRILTLAAKAALSQEDYTNCWSLCQQLIEEDHQEEWEICNQLGQCDKFSDLEARCRLLSYSVIYCPSDAIEDLLRARNLLELQCLHQQLRSQIDESSKDASWVKPLQQTRDLTQQVLWATGHVTKSVISQMTKANFWNENLQQEKCVDNLQVEENEKSVTNNKNFERQGCHPFYSDVVERCHKSASDVDYGHFITRPPFDTGFNLAYALLRAGILAESVTEKSQSCLDSSVLMKLAEATLNQDCSLGLSYLWTLKSPLDSDTCLNSLPKSDVSLQLTCYYFALQVLFRINSDLNTDQNVNFLLNPDDVIKLALVEADRININSTDENLLQCSALLKQHYDTLSDMLQGQLLHRLGRGVDVVRFSLDPQYKVNTILGLAMTLDDNVYETAVTLAARYDIPSFQVFINHLQFIFSESSLSTSEIEKRVNRLELIPRLSKHSAELSRFFTRSIYPTISGLDHSRLLYYYQLQEKCGCKTPAVQSQIRLLTKIKNIAPSLDFKKLINADDPLILIGPCLTKENVHTFAKLANQLSDTVGPLNQSSVYSVWIQKMFFQVDQTSINMTIALWVHRYEACFEFEQKLKPRDVVSMVKGLVFSQAALQNLPVEARKEIVRRVLKHSKAEFNKNRSVAEKDEWQKCVEQLNSMRNHLEWRSSEDVETASRQSDLIKYVDGLDLSISDIDAVHRVLIDSVIEGNSMNLVQQLVSICPTEACLTPAEVVESALRHLTEQLKLNYDNSLDIPQFKCIQNILNQIHDHLNESGDLLMVEDIVGALRPFCSDPSVNLNLRLNMLQELEKVFTLEGDDALMVLLYHTQIILAAAWPDILVSLDDVSSVEGRESLLDKLLPQCLTTPQCLVMTRLLISWPPLPSSSSVEKDAWYRVLNCFLQCKQEDAIDAYISVLQCWPADVPPLNLECTEQLLNRFPDNTSLIHRLKFLLLSSHTSLHEKATTLIKDNQVSRGDIDDEILQLLLRNNLSASVVESSIFSPLVEFLLEKQFEENKPDYYRVETVAKELNSAGFSFEAGTLLLHHHSAPSSLRTFRAAFDTLKSWL